MNTSDVASLATAFEALLPAHKGGLYIQHQPQAANYMTAAEWAAWQDEQDLASWVSDEQRAKAIETESIWTLQWYPDTPVGFHVLAAADLSALLSAVTLNPPS